MDLRVYLALSGVRGGLQERGFFGGLYRGSWAGFWGVPKGVFFRVDLRVFLEASPGRRFFDFSIFPLFSFVKLWPGGIWGASGGGNFNYFKGSPGGVPGELPGPSRGAGFKGTF